MVDRYAVVRLPVTPPNPISRHDTLEVAGDDCATGEQKAVRGNKVGVQRPWSIERTIGAEDREPPTLKLLFAQLLPLRSFVVLQGRQGQAQDATRKVRYWHHALVGIHIALNVSPMQLQIADLLPCR